MIGPGTRCGTEDAGAITLIGKHGRIGRGCTLEDGITVLPGGAVEDGRTMERPS
ncbi:MAG: hypothetical protein R3E12_20355 [Candidatus Eisenbacteria bacterium]